MSVHLFVCFLFFYPIYELLVLENTVVFSFCLMHEKVCVVDMRTGVSKSLAVFLFSKSDTSN